MLRALQNLPKVLRANAPWNTNRANLPQNPASLLNEKATDYSSELTDYGLCAKPAGHTTVFSSWLHRASQVSLDLHRHHTDLTQQQQWQSHKKRQSESEALGWGTAVVVAIQLCRALSSVTFPDRELSGDLKQSLVTVAKLLPIHPSCKSAARTVLSREDGSAGSSSSSSISFSTNYEDSLQDLSFSSSGEEVVSGIESKFFGQTKAKDEVVSGASGEIFKSCKQPSLSTDQIIPALEGALRQLSKTSLKTQGMIETMMGIQFAKLGNDEKAAAHFTTASQLGYSKAQFNLGQYYELGKGVELNLMKAITLYQSAADQDHPLALYKLGMFHYHGLQGILKDESVGITYMQRAAAGGMILAHSFLGNYYLQAKTRDLQKAIFHLNRAVEEQETESEYLLGLCYEQGWGVHQNKRTAARLYHKAAKGGYPLAMYSLGIYYESGFGDVIQDRDHAKKLYSDASERGLDLATEKLSRLSSLAEKRGREESESRRAIFTSGRKSVDDKLKLSESKGNHIHSSNSEPSLLPRRNDNESKNCRGNSVTLSYLSLILPSVLRTSNVEDAPNIIDGKRGTEDAAVNFQIGADDDDDDDIPAWRLGAVESAQLVV